MHATSDDLAVVEDLHQVDRLFTAIIHHSAYGMYAHADQVIGKLLLLAVQQCDDLRHAQPHPSQGRVGWQSPTQGAVAQHLEVYRGVVNHITSHPVFSLVGDESVEAARAVLQRLCPRINGLARWTYGEEVQVLRKSGRKRQQTLARQAQAPLQTRTQPHASPKRPISHPPPPRHPIMTPTSAPPPSTQPITVIPPSTLKPTAVAPPSAIRPAAIQPQPTKQAPLPHPQQPARFMPTPPTQPGDVTCAEIMPTIPIQQPWKPLPVLPTPEEEDSPASYTLGRSWMQQDTVEGGVRLDGLAQVSDRDWKSRVDVGGFTLRPEHCPSSRCCSGGAYGLGFGSG